MALPILQQGNQSEGTRSQYGKKLCKSSSICKCNNTTHPPRALLYYGVLISCLVNAPYVGPIDADRRPCAVMRYWPELDPMRSPTMSSSWTFVNSESVLPEAKARWRFHKKPTATHNNTMAIAMTNRESSDRGIHHGSIEKRCTRDDGCLSQARGRQHHARQRLGLCRHARTVRNL